MHEFSIMESALATAAQKTRAAGATQIHRLKLRVGQLSGVVPEALRFAFAALKTGSPAAAAELEIEEVPAVGWCADCAAEFAAADLKYAVVTERGLSERGGFGLADWLRRAGGTVIFEYPRNVMLDAHSPPKYESWYLVKLNHPKSD